MRFHLWQTVYIPVEDFIDVKWSANARVYYRVAKCKVESIPKDNAYQYRLGEVDHKPKKLYYKYAKEIYDTCFGAIKVAEEWAQKEELWNLRYSEGEVVYRPWSDSDGTKKELYKLQKTFQKTEDRR